MVEIIEKVLKLVALVLGNIKLIQEIAKNRQKPKA